MTVTPELVTAVAIAVTGYVFSLGVSALNEYLRRRQAAGSPASATLLAVAAALNFVAANPDKANTQRKASNAVADSEPKP